MEIDLKYGHDLFREAKTFLRKNIKLQLLLAISNKQLLSTNGFGELSSFLDRLLIEVAMMEKLTVILGKHQKYIDMLRENYKYQHIYNPMGIKSSSASFPHRVIIDDKVIISSLKSVDIEIVAGFRDGQHIINDQVE
jgi:hypothetical protein